VNSAPSAECIWFKRLMTRVRFPSSAPSIFAKAPTGSNTFDTTFPAELWPPYLGDYTDASVRAMAQRVASSIIQINASIKAYRDSSDRSFEMQGLEALFRELMLPVLAFAFGLSGGRRMIDLYLDLPVRWKKWMRYQYVVRTQRGADVRFSLLLIAARPASTPTS
jgi:hypothetical protein